MKHCSRHRIHALTLVELLALLAALLLGAAVLFPIFGDLKHAMPTTCLSNVKQMSLAMIMYDDDSGSAPAADQWIDRCAIYSKTEVIYHCTFLKKDPNNYGYAMRTKLGGVDLQNLKHPEQEPMIFDTELVGRNVHTNFVSLPAFQRHPGQTVGYADGHAKRLKSQ